MRCLMCSISCQLIFDHVLLTSVSLHMCVAVSCFVFLIILFSWHQYWLVVDFCMLSASSNIEILLRWAHIIFMLPTWVVQIVKKSRSHLSIFCAKRVTWNKFLIEDPQILGTIVQNLVTKVTWHPEFVHPCCGELYKDMR